MKCSNCGAELSDDTKFCSYCGKKIEETVSASSTAQKMQNFRERITNEIERTDNEKTNGKKSIADKMKQKGASAWNKLSTYGKITTIVVAIFVFLCIIAFLFGKTFAAIITILQIALTVIALLMKKQIIKVPKNWLYVIILTFAIILLIPYVYLFKSDYENIKRFKWSDIVLSDIAPETKSRSGEILINSKDHLSLDIYGINQNQYADYIEDCKEGGFTIDAEQLESSFAAYNNSGYKLSLYYYTNDSIMHIDLDAAYQYGTVVWPNGGLADMIPVPKSTVGEISKDDEVSFLAYVANTSIDDFKSYIALCIDKGFIVDSHDTKKAYFAKNSEGYRLSVEYQGNNVICIAVDEPEYEVNIEVECVANWFFSKYDVDIYVDGSLAGRIPHGASESNTVTLTKGVYEIKFVNAEDDDVTGITSIDIQKDEMIKYKISCSSTKISVENITESYEDDAENQSAGDTESESMESKSDENELPEGELMEDESVEDKLDFSWIEDAISNNHDVDAEVLDEYGAWEAVQRYGESRYSYFHVHSMDNKLSAKQIDDNTWELKAYCDVDDGNGTRKNSTCEATVEGTNLNARVTDFIVY